MRILLIPVLPVLGILLLTFLYTEASLAVVVDADRASTLASATVTTVEFLHQLGREQAETVALRDRGGASGMLLVTAQQARTDHAAASYQSAVRAVRVAAPGLASTIDEVTAVVAGLAQARQQALAGLGPGTALPNLTVQFAYAPFTTALLEVAETVPTQLVDRDLSNRTQAIALLVGAKVSLSQQADLLHTAFSRHVLTSSDRTTMTQLATSEQEKLSAFNRIADSTARHTLDALMIGPDVETTTSIRDSAIKSTGDTIMVDPDAWYVAVEHTVRRLHQVELILTNDLSRLAGQTRSNGATRTAVAIVVALSVSVATIVATVVMSLRISRRITSLGRMALAASDGLGEAVAKIAAAEEPAHARDVFLWTQPQMGRGPARPDEISQVSAALVTVHGTALRLAADQALLRRDVESLVAALATRSQALVQRQLHAIDRLEEKELDPDRLTQYYIIDHLANRMLRNDENLLVLAGSQPSRHLSRPYPLYEVIRAASAEIADYQRIDIADVPPFGISGHAIGDIVHLLAELLENAANFSAAQSRVTVTANRSVDGVRLVIYDRGNGMSTDAVALANQRVTHPATLTSALTNTMGLLVVARLAARHRIAVELRSHEHAGTVCLIDLPDQVLVEPPARTSSPLTTAAWRRRLTVQENQPRQTAKLAPRAQI
jgi:anti-sigma regulatory factor (Ser/Thr protein kinase)